MITVFIRNHPTRGKQHILKINNCELTRITHTQVSQGIDPVCDVVCSVIIGFSDSCRFEEGKIIMPNGDYEECQLLEMAPLHPELQGEFIVKFACKATLE